MKKRENAGRNSRANDDGASPVRRKTIAVISRVMMETVQEEDYDEPRRV